MPSPAPARSLRARATPIALATGLVGTLVLSLSLTGTLSAFAASITNTTNTAGAGSLVMKETLVSSTGPGSTSNAVCSSTDGGGLGTNAANCSTINKFGGDLGLTPDGASSSTQITIQNTGTGAAKTFRLVPASCTQSSPTSSTGGATDLCSKLRVAITSDSTNVFTGTAADLAAGGPIVLKNPPAAGATVPFTFVVTLDGSAGNSYQLLTASMPLTWQFSG